MKIRCFHVDAFCGQLFQGNPAMVCLLPTWLSAEQLQCLAAEHHLPVTAFIVADNEGFSIRWFTPECELDLCGHGTLAAALVILTILMPSQATVNVTSHTAGVMTISRVGNFLHFDFPRKDIVPISIDPAIIQALNVTPEEVWQCDNERLMIVLANENLVQASSPDIARLKTLAYRGIILCAAASGVDFVSRTFYPHKAIPEDAVTGASHCYLAPYFAKRLHRSSLEARQLSKRGGHLWLDVHSDHITIKAQAMLYSTGIIAL